MALQSLVWIIPLPPLLAFALISLFAFRSRSLSHWLALAGAGLSWLGSMVIFFRVVSIPNLNENPLLASINWFPVGAGWFRIGVQVDPLTAIVLFFVAWTVLMIFIYSVGYHNYGQPVGAHDQRGLPPEGATVKEHGRTHKVPSVEPMYSRFFAFISLFAFAMFTLAVTDNLLVLYVAWEIMGLCSYLLIGFWYAKPSARDAAIKAFLVTRIGDMFMLLGMAALYALTGTLNFREILANPAVLAQLASTISPVFGLSWAGLIGLLIFAGTVGKSAQFPLHVWLPDAMEGPTPVSAMIHAATMVSAGVYLAIRFYPLMSAGWLPDMPLTPPLFVMAAVGAFTALFAAVIAVAQNDIKRVLAYSTISQLGYMVAALGVGAYVAASFHLLTHAFFKALLFLGSGSVIHGMEHGSLHSGQHLDAQDMTNMGGLRKKMPLTFATFLIGGLALSGFPLLTAGFWSKDEILAGAFDGGYLIVFAALALAALLTAFYTARQITLTFLGKPRTQSAEHASESRPTMVYPLVVLAFFAVTAGWIGIPHNFPVLGHLVPNWMENFVGSMVPKHEPLMAPSRIPLLTSLVVSLGGLFLGWWTYRGAQLGAPDPLRRPLGPLYAWMKDKFYVDQIYHTIFVVPAEWFAETVSYRLIDQGILDGILNAVGRVGMLAGRFLRFVIDVPLINGAGNALGEGTRELGADLHRAQTGRVQQYMVIAISVLVFVGVLIYYIYLA